MIFASWINDCGERACWCSAHKHAGVQQLAGPFGLEALTNQEISFKKLTAKSKKVWSRSSQIPSFLLGKTISVYNGKEFKPVLVTREKIGFKFGDFSITRKYGNKLKNSKLKNKK